MIQSHLYRLCVNSVFLIVRHDETIFRNRVRDRHTNRIVRYKFPFRVEYYRNYEFIKQHFDIIDWHMIGGFIIFIKLSVQTEKLVEKNVLIRAFNIYNNRC